MSAIALADPMTNKFGPWITGALERMGKSQVDLAKHMGEDRATVNRIISGKRHLRADELAALIQYFGEMPPALRATDLKTRRIQVEAIANDDTWVERTRKPGEEIAMPIIEDERFPADAQYPVKDGDRYVICVPIDMFYRNHIPTDTVHAIRDHRDAELVQHVVGKWQRLDQSLTIVGVAIGSVEIFLV